MNLDLPAWNITNKKWARESGRLKNLVLGQQSLAEMDEQWAGEAVLAIRTVSANSVDRP